MTCSSVRSLPMILLPSIHCCTVLTLVSRYNRIKLILCFSVQDRSVHIHLPHGRSLMPPDLILPSSLYVHLGPRYSPSVSDDPCRYIQAYSNTALFSSSVHNSFLYNTYNISLRISSRNLEGLSLSKRSWSLRQHYWVVGSWRGMYMNRFRTQGCKLNEMN